MTSSTEGGPRPKVVYVMGAGRSGSSILGVCLGNCEGVFYAGELDKWPLREGVPSRKKDQRRMRFWEQVLARVERPETVFGRDAHNNMERSSALYRPGRLRAARRLRPEYLRVTEDLYRAIAGVAGDAVIVDSSHYPLRARELQRLEGIELYVLLLVRDPQEIVASWDRDDVDEPRFGEMKTNLYLWLTYALSAGTFLRQPAGCWSATRTCSQSPSASCARSSTASARARRCPTSTRSRSGRRCTGTGCSPRSASRFGASRGAGAPARAGSRRRCSSRSRPSSSACGPPSPPAIGAIRRRYSGAADDRLE
jgi:hypothetical protein